MLVASLVRHSFLKESPSISLCASEDGDEARGRAARRASSWDWLGREAVLLRGPLRRADRALLTSAKESLQG